MRSGHGHLHEQRTTARASSAIVDVARVFAPTPTPTHKRHRGASRRIVSHTASIVSIIVFVIAWVLAGLPEYQSAQLGAQRGTHRHHTVIEQPTLT